MDVKRFTLNNKQNKKIILTRDVVLAKLFPESPEVRIPLGPPRVLDFLAVAVNCGYPHPGVDPIEPPGPP